MKYISSFSVLLILVLYPVYTPAQSFTSSNLPIVIINTHGQQIVNEPKIPAEMKIIYKGEGVRNYITDPPDHFNGYIGIEIRGSSSLQYPKKQYGVETRNIMGEDSSVSLLGLPAETDWILYAPYSDKTLIRDVLAYKLSREMGRYATRSHYCEVVINGEYMGVYVLFERIKRDKNRVNISKMDSLSAEGDLLTGGYIIKIDKPDGEPNEDWFSTTSPFPGSWQRIRYVHHYPKPEDITTLQHNYIRSFVEAFEGCMSGPFYSDPVLGYSKYIDIDSFVDYFIHNEVTKNVDAYRISAYMYKDRDSKGGKLFMGPVWDYNIAFGNGDYHDVWLSTGWHIDFLTTNSYYLQTDEFQVPFWWKKLYKDKIFRNKVRARWEQLKDSVFNRERIFSYIDSTVAVLNESRIRNYQKWPIIGIYVWPNHFIGQTYEAEINFMKQFIRDRLNWINANMIGELTDTNENGVIPAAFELSQNYPNPFNPSTIISYSIPDAAVVEIKIHDITGREVVTLVNEYKEAGRYNIEFNSDNLSGSASGVYMYTLKSGGTRISRKMVLLK